MTKDQIEAVIDRVRSWPKHRQEDAAAVLVAMEAQSSEAFVLTPEERSDLEAALNEVARGDFAADADVEAVFARYRA